MILQPIEHEVDFCVVGGGLAGVCAAIAAARNGISTLLMQERPMLGGNASSEVRMWVCGARGSNNRETGLIEEIALENLYANPDKSPYLFDSILLEKAKAEPNLTLLLNCSCMDAETVGGRIVSVTGWQMTTQTFHRVTAQLFADCSGDSILAPLCGAHFRQGREAASEFGEPHTVTVADSKTMGISCLIQARREDRKSVFRAPDRIIRPTEEQLRYRRPNLSSTGENFWYLEYGGELDCIADAETIRDRLLALALGMWDYIKNSGEFPDADYWKLDFLGFLPAKRESRRMCGLYMMNSKDVLSGGRFPDTVAFGGWGLDDHDPRGFFSPDRPNVNLPTPSPYGIPYRCLYSENIANLFFAGRNISMTHAAMSSTRVMATCAVLGQAVGTAAAVAIRNRLTPDGVYAEKIDELQQTLMDQDCFLPGFCRRVSPLARNAELTCDGVSGAELNRLRNGIDRNNPVCGEGEMGCTVPAGASIRYRFREATEVNRVRVTFDSDLDRLTLPGDRIERTHITRANTLPDSPSTRLPTTLVKSFEVWGEAEDGREILLARETENRLRTVHIDVSARLRAVRLVPLQTWYEQTGRIHLFSFDLS